MVTSALDDGGAGTLRKVIAAAADNSTINFDPTVFTGPTTIKLTQGEIPITANNLTISNQTVNNITIDAQNNATNTSRIFDISGNGLSETISNLIFQNGTAPGATENHFGEGGAIYDEGSLTLTNDQFYNSTAGLNGGAVYNIASGAANTVTVNNSKFQSNTVNTSMGAGGKGGAIYTIGSNLSIHTGGFTSNTAATSGGAVYAVGPAGTTLTADTQSSFVNNKALAGDGGAISTSDKLVLNQRDNFQSNQAANRGGAVYYNNSTDSMTLTNVTFIGNTASDGGAVMSLTNNNTGTVTDTISGSFFSNNMANVSPSADYGGALSIEASTRGSGSFVANITNNTLYQNSSEDYGGGIALALYNYGTGNNTVTLTSLTIYQNQAATGGGGVWANLASNGGSSPVALVLHNNIIAGNGIENPVSDGPDILVIGLGQGNAQFVSEGYNLIGIDDDGTTQHQYRQTWQGSDHVGFENAPQIPWLDPAGPQLNGGPTKTIKLIPQSGNNPGGGYRQGDPTLAGQTDQRGYIRQNGPPPVTVSIGAYDPDATSSSGGSSAAARRRGASHGMGIYTGGGTLTLTSSGHSTSAPPHG